MIDPLCNNLRDHTFLSDKEPSHARPWPAPQVYGPFLICLNTNPPLHKCRAVLERFGSCGKPGKAVSRISAFTVFMAVRYDIAQTENGFISCNTFLKTGFSKCFVTVILPETWGIV